MTKAEVIKLLRENKNERGIAKWKKQGEKGTSLKSFGIGLTQLRKIAKKLAAIIGWRGRFGTATTTTRRSWAC